MLRFDRCHTLDIDWMMDRRCFFLSLSMEESLSSSCFLKSKWRVATSDKKQ